MSEWLDDDVSYDGKLYPPYFWTKDRVERLKHLVNQGLSASQIGIELGCTKNMVIGKCDRDDIYLKHSRKIARAPLTPNPFPERGCCLWPIGDPRKPGFHFCGERVSPNHQSYCRTHTKVAGRKIVLTESMI